MFDMDFLLLDQSTQLEAERRDIVDDVARAFLEGHEDPWLAMFACTVDQEGGRKQRLAASRRSADQSRPSRGKSAKGEIVKPFDAGG